MADNTMKIFRITGRVIDLKLQEGMAGLTSSPGQERGRQHKRGSSDI
jgi:hypothetical protein